MLSWILKTDKGIPVHRWWKFMLPKTTSYWLALAMEPEMSLACKKKQRLFSFGLIADVQYADIDNRLNFSKTRMRYYRNALHLLQEAVNSWNESPENLSFVVQLGDLLDGFNSEKGKAESSAATGLLFSELDKCTAPVHGVLGNHEFYNFNRKELFERGYYSGYKLHSKTRKNKTNIISNQSKDKPIDDQSYDEVCRALEDSPSDYPSYYHFSPFEGFRILLLDTYDLSVLGYGTDTEVYKESSKILRSVNKNDAWNSPENLGLNERHFVAFNGGVGHRQLHWLKTQLTEATEKEEKVIIFAHCPIFPAISDTLCLVWNHQEVLAILHQFKTVVAVFCGHTHLQDYAMDGHGIHHLSLPGIVEIPPGENGYATVDVYNDRLHVCGVGVMPSFTFEL